MGDWQRRLTVRLLRAVESGGTTRISALLNEGADPNATLPGSPGDTLLMRSLLHRHEEGALLLLQHKADPCATNGEGRYPLLLAAQMADQM